MRQAFIRQTSLATAEIIRRLEVGGTDQPKCLLANELAILAAGGDLKAEAKLRQLLREGNEGEKYVAYWGLKGLQETSPATKVALDNFEQRPGNERFKIPPRPRP
jgi:hypothetical protein